MSNFDEEDINEIFLLISSAKSHVFPLCGLPLINR